MEWSRVLVMCAANTATVPLREPPPLLFSSPFPSFPLSPTPTSTVAVDAVSFNVMDEDLR